MKKMLLLGLLLPLVSLMTAADLVEVHTLTPTVVALRFVDGTVHYHGYHQEESDDVLVSRPLPLERAAHFYAYQVASSDDPNFASPVNPVKVGRKSKPVFFDRNCKWTGTICDNDYVLEHWIYLELPHAMERGASYAFWVGDLADNLDRVEFTFDEKFLRSELIHVNQHGYVPSSRAKFAYLAHWAGDFGALDLDFLQGAAFHLVRMDDHSVAYSGTVSKRRDLDDSQTDFSQPETWGTENNLYGSDVWEVDFSDFQIPGEYRLVVDGVGTSFPFSLDENVYREAYYYTTRGLYFQRAGIEKETRYAGKWAKPRDHHPDDGLMKLYYTTHPSVLTGEGSASKDDILDNVVGEITDWGWGWYHDAGDWDGYVHHTDVPYFLLAAYELAPRNFGDNELNIPESGNGVPDILDEAAWLINYFRRNQQPEGGIAGGRVNSDFNDKPKSSPSYEDDRPFYVGGMDPQTSYLFAGLATQYAHCLEIAGHTAHSADLLSEAKAAYAWAEQHHDMAPDAKVKGASLSDLRMFAAAGIFKLSGELSFQEDFKAENRLSSASSSLAGGGYNQKWAVWTYITSPDHAGVDAELKAMLQEAAVNYAVNEFLDPAKKRSARVGYAWSKPAIVGSTTTPINIAPMFAHHLAEGELKDELMDHMQSTADYFLGNNPLNMSWITGLGDRHPERMLHLDSRYDRDMLDENIPGLVPYGPLRHGDHFQGTDAQGPWDADFAKIRSYPERYAWPVSEFWFDNPYSVLDGEFTVHQTNAPAASSYGYLAADTMADFFLNAPPEIQILTPGADMELDEQDFLTVQVQVTDEQPLAYVQYYLDHHPVGMVREAPYHLNRPILDLLEGEFLLRARAVDADGMESWADGPRLSVAPAFRPTLLLSSGEDSLAQGQALEVQVEPIQPDGVTVSEVSLWLNGVEVERQDAAPYLFQVDSAYPLYNEFKAVVSYEEGFQSTAKQTRFATPGVAGVAFKKKDLEVHSAESVRLEYEVVPAEAANKAVSFHSLDEGVATVNDAGLVRGEAEGSTRVVITTEEGGFTDTATVQVLPPRPRGPYGGKPLYLPAILEAEHFDYGGEGFAYHDKDPGNSEEEYRFEDVDVGKSFDEGATAYQVTGVQAGEWLNYTIDVPEDGLYDFRFRYTAGAVDPSITLKSDGEEILNLSLPQVGWWPLADGTVEDIPLKEGEQVLTIQFENGPLTLNYVEILCPECTSVPPRELALNYAQLELPVGAHIQLHAQIDPVTATNQRVFWSDTGDGVVYVDAKGRVTGLAPGTAAIIAETEARGLRDTCMVNVKEGSAHMPGLDYAYYEGDWELTPDFDTLEAVELGRVSNFDLGPARVEDHFGFRFTGGIMLPEAGDYVFYTSSDDGSLLYINDELVVDNDGLHAVVEQGGSISLDSGLHQIEVRFFEKAGGASLEVQYEGPGLDKQVIPDSVLTTHIEGQDLVAVDGISMPLTFQLPLGSSMYLPVEFTPEEASDQFLSFSSDDEAVVGFDTHNRASGRSEGRAMVTVTSRDGAHQATSQVDVINDAPEVVLLGPADQAEFSDTTRIPVSFQASDSIGGVEYIQVWIDGSGLAPSDPGSTLLLLEALTAGPHDLQVLASDLHGKQGESEKHRIVVYSTVAVSEKERNYSALQVQPNPFGDEVHFILKLEKRSEVSLKIYDLKGSLLHEEAPREHPPGEVDMHWDGTSGGQQLMTGTYLCRILVHDKDGELIHQEVLVKN